MKNNIKKALALFMCLLTMAAFMPTIAFADDVTGEASQTSEQGSSLDNGAGSDAAGSETGEAADNQDAAGGESTTAEEPDAAVKYAPPTPAADAGVTITVNLKGVLASAKDNSAMLNKAVTVKDKNSDGKLTYDEALAAAHDEYFSGGADAGYGTSTSSYGTSVTKLWGETTYNTLFFINGKGIATGVGDDVVKAGDALYASVNADNTNYADWYTYFNKTTRTVDKNEEFTLNLKGFQGMAGGTAKIAKGVKVGIWKDGKFQQSGSKTTDGDGNVVLSFDTAGTYIVTANGSVSDTWTDWSGKSITADCPIMAPACVVTVENTGTADATVYFTVNNKGTIAKDKNGKAMKNREVTVKDTDSDGHLSYDEALAAMHSEYYDGGAEAGYAQSKGWVSKLWGVSGGTYLFFKNEEGLSTGVTGDFVEAGDSLYASVLKDSKYYSDYYGFFNETSKSVDIGESFTLTLKAKPGMTPGDAVAVSDAVVGQVDDNGDFQQIQHKETDSNGKVKLSFSKAGTYYVSVSDAELKDIVVTDWNLTNLAGGEPAVYGTMDYSTYESKVAYTDADYGNGPYPADEVKYVDLNIWKAAQSDYNTLHSNQLIVDAAVMAPICKVTVGGEESGVIYSLKKALAELKALGLVPEVKTTAVNTKSIELSWSSRIAADGYELSTDNGSTWKEVSGNKTTISGLDPGTVYKYQMRGYTYINGEGTDQVYSSVANASVTTPLDNTGTPSVTSKSKRFTVKWNSVEGAAGYQVWVGKNSSVTKGVVKYTTSKLTQVTKKFSKKKNYYVKVRAYKGSVYGAWSPAKKIKCR